MTGTTLNELKGEAVRRAQPKPQIKSYTLADFATEEEIEELHWRNLQKSSKRKTFDSVDQLCAEIVARFGFKVYEKWNKGEISDKKIAAWLAAERAREAQQQTHLEMVIVATVSSCIKRHKGEPRSKGLDRAIKLIKENFKIIRGDKNNGR